MLGFLKGLKFPLRLIRIFRKKPQKVRSEREEKQRKYVRNFAPRHYSWQKSLGKDKKKKGRKGKFIKRLRIQGNIRAREKMEGN